MIDEPCKIFVAAYTEQHAIIVFTDSDLVSELIGMHSAMVADVMGGLEPPADGLWMFVGQAKTPALAAVDVYFEGEWRRPTEVELAAAGNGENPCLEPCGT